MQRYDSYKDSGVKWLGEIPSHWEMKRWRFLMNENAKKNSDCKLRLQLQFRYGDIVRKANQSEESDVLDTISKYTVVAPNDIMINGLNLNYDFISQRVAQVKEEGVITSAYISLRPTQIANSSYYTYFLKSMDAKKMFHGMGTGIRLTLSYNELKNQFIPMPSLKEQESISNYLDATTSKIDEAIAQQQKMIDLLNERKQIIINNAVTKGLDPNVKMKPSGIDWIGDIPEHWEIRKVKSFGTINSGDGIKNSELSEEGKYPVWGGNGLMGYTDKYNKSKDAIVIGRVGALCGNVRYLSNPTFVSDNALILNITNKHINHTFLLYALEAANLNSLNTSSAQPLITGSKVKNVYMPYPPKPEQGQIVFKLHKKLISLNMSITTILFKISLLQERKQIIINDVVTGKVKVI